MTVWRYSSKYAISNVNQVDFDTSLLDVLLLKCKLHMLSFTGTSCLPSLFSFCPSLNFLSCTFAFSLPTSVLLPFVVNSPHTSLLHFNLRCCSPSLKVAQLNVSPP